MPTFDFQCQDCHHIFEFTRPFGSTELPPCPTCQSTNVLKQLSTPSIHFKGDGFYKTDSTATAKPAKEASSAPKEEAKPAKPEKTEVKTPKNAD